MEENRAYRVGVLGAGTWGTALARMLDRSGKQVVMWSALPAEVRQLTKTRRHPNLPDMIIPDDIRITGSIEEACTGADMLLFAVPSPFVRQTAAAARCRFLLRLTSYRRFCHRHRRDPGQYSRDRSGGRPGRRQRCRHPDDPPASSSRPPARR